MLWTTMEVIVQQPELIHLTGAAQGCSKISEGCGYSYSYKCMLFTTTTTRSLISQKTSRLC